MIDFDNNKEVCEYVESNIIAHLDVLNNSEIVENRYTKVKVELEPVAVALYDYIIGIEAMLNCDFGFNLTSPVIENMIEKFTLCKLYFNIKYRREYMLLLD